MMPGQHTQHAALGATRYHTRGRRFRKHAAVARAAEVRRENRGLPLEPEDGAVDVWFLQEDADVVGKVARGKIVRAVDDDVVRLGDLPRVFAGKECLVQIHLDVRIYVAQTVACRVQLLAAHVLRAVQDLALQVRVVHHVKVYQPDPSHPGRRKVERDG